MLGALLLLLQSDGWRPLELNGAATPAGLRAPNRGDEHGSNGVLEEDGGEGVRPGAAPHGLTGGVLMSSPHALRERGRRRRRGGRRRR
jgi:hypothetical protein